MGVGVVSDGVIMGYGGSGWVGCGRVGGGYKGPGHDSRHGSRRLDSHGSAHFAAQGRTFTSRHSEINVGVSCFQYIF